jgi:L-fuconolactonase
VIRIDAHHHLWELGTRPHAWLDGAGMAAIRRDFTLADLAPLTAAAGIDRTILVQVLPSPAETAEFLTLADAPGPVAGLIGWAGLTSGRLPQALDALRSGPAARTWSASAIWCRASRTHAGWPGRTCGGACARWSAPGSSTTC